MRAILAVVALLVLLAGGCGQPGGSLRTDPLDNMPILGDRGRMETAFGLPEARRDAQYIKWLSASVKIDVGGGVGSGTIVYYDAATNVAYVATCGHLWGPRGRVISVDDAIKKPVSCKVVVWYHNNTKLPGPKAYPARVMFSSWRTNCDTGLVTFQPDWKPSYFPIAPANRPVVPGQRLHSLGCDGDTEVAHYDIEVSGMESGDLVTRYNSPRPGRSGGGLMDDTKYVGTCWGTSKTDGSGIGFFTPLAVIHSYWAKQKGYEWLLSVKDSGQEPIGRLYPIVDRNGPQGKYQPDYIPLPVR